MLGLTRLLGQSVRSADGRHLGRLVDLVVEVEGGSDGHPVVRRLVLGQGRHARLFADWEAVASFELDDMRLTPDAATDPNVAAASDSLWLGRDVLDTQIVDIAGKRLARVAEVMLARRDDQLRAVAVEIGTAGVLRRLGLGRVADRLQAQLVDWCDLHLLSPRGHAIQLATPSAQVHRLGPVELATLVAHLPTARAAEVLRTVPRSAAAGALGVTHPELGGRLLDALPDADAAALVERMPVDEATRVLRRVPAQSLDPVLAGVPGERAATLRRLLRHRVDTAGGLMNTIVRTARPDEDAEMIRQRLTADLPELESLATVFVVDEAQRPVGVVEPTDLLAGRTQAKAVPTIPVDLPAEDVIDLFALHDFLAMPVVDADGRLVGAIGADDVLEALLAERLPGHSRFAAIRRRARPGRRHRTKA